MRECRNGKDVKMDHRQNTCMVAAARRTGGHVAPLRKERFPAGVHSSKSRERRVGIN